MVNKVSGLSKRLSLKAVDIPDFRFFFFESAIVHILDTRPKVPSI